MSHPPRRRTLAIRNIGSLVIPFALLLATQAQAAPDCSVKSVPQPLPLRPTALPPLSAELSGSGRQLGAPDGVLAYASNEQQSVDRVLLRLRMEGCQNVAQAADYVPRTKWDNGPWRFSAGGEGKKFSAEEFSAWMESRGVHVAKGNKTGAGVPAQPQPQADEAPAGN